MDKYKNVAALTPAGEDFDQTAFVNEGGYLSVAHIDAVEKKLGDDAAAIAGHPTVVKDLNDKITAAEAAKKTAEDSLATANSTIATQTTEIATLKAKIVELNKKPATEATSTTTNADAPPTGGNTKIPAHLDPENSLNKAADAIIRKKKKP